MHIAPHDRLPHILQAIAGECSYDGVLRAMAGELAAILPFDHIDIVMLVAEGRDHICYETPQCTMWSTLAEAPQPTVRSPVRSVLRGAAPYILADDAFTDERFHFDGAIDQPIFKAMLRSRVIVPLQVRNLVFGSINISRQRVNAYGPLDLLVCQQCAEVVGPYLYALMVGRARSHGEGAGEMDALRASLLRLTDRLEQDRRRLGMDLHDQTIADLSRIARRVASLEGCGAELKPALKEIQAEIGDCLMELRHIVEDALPAVLDLFGFVDALDDVMRRSQVGLEPAMRLMLEDASDGAADRLTDIDRTLAYRIVQEAINNAARHSGGTCLSVQLETCGDELHIAVEDDGCGGADPRSPHGISHMRSRAALIDAQVRFGSGSGGRGTRVEVRVPLGGAYRRLTQ